MTSERNMAIYEMRQNGASLSEIARKYNLTKERIRQIALRAGELIDRQNRLESFNQNISDDKVDERLNEIVDSVSQLEKQLEEIVGERYIALTVSLDDVDLSVRSRNVLTRALHLETLGDVTQYAEWQLLREPNFGRTSLKEVKAVLKSFGLKLKDG